MLKLNLGAGAHPLPGFVNLDKATGWRFEDGLPDYEDGSVDAVTISHALYLVPLGEWPAVFAEFARVLKPGGVVRITEDATDDPASERYGGYHDAVTLTSARLVIDHARAVDLDAYTTPSGLSFAGAEDLIQEHHGVPPKVFHVEAIKP